MNTISTELPPTSQPSPEQELTALIADVAFHVDFLTGAGDDIRTALDAVDDVEIDDVDAKADIADAVETVRAALDSGLAAVEQALGQLDHLTGTAKQAKNDQRLLTKFDERQQFNHDDDGGFPFPD